MTDLATVLRANGRRLTPQRRRIVEALAGLGHATPDAVAAQVGADGGASVPLSTIYRGLEALEALGVVSHTHLDHRAPTYHLTGHADHVHLVCRACGRIDEVPASAATEFVAQISASRGFAADVTHMAVHGVCAECRS
ncbi:MAG: transcriptional repressor [Actinomycetales bacterium]|jgi:Fur family ferric uptake transcriptional regulator|nr:transcriptional repressor [Actinomycetales bacterium]